jgi:hypothetical protein
VAKWGNRPAPPRENRENERAARTARAVHSRALEGGFEMKRIIGQAIIVGTLVAVPAAAIAHSATDASPLDDKKGEKSKDKDKKDGKKKSPAPAPSSSPSH